MTAVMGRVRAVKPPPLAADAWTPDRGEFRTRALDVILSAPLERFLQVAQFEETPAVLVTRPTARLSQLATYALADAGATWVLEDAAGRRWSASDTWQDASSVAPRLMDPDFSFEVYCSHRPTTRLEVGRHAEVMIAVLGGDLVKRWGTHEPLFEPWSLPAVTQATRDGMPTAPRLLLRGDRAVGALDVYRDAAGVVERTRGVAVAGHESRVDRAARAAAALRAAYECGPVDVGIVTERDTDPGLVNLARHRSPDAPLAVLLGPKFVKDLGADPEDLASRHRIEVLGRTKTPSLLVTFASADTSLWVQILAFALDLQPKYATDETWEL